jgi:hypothetical protein
MQPQTMDALRSAGYLKEGDTIVRSRLADDLNGILITKPFDDMAAVDQDALIVAELVHQLFGALETDPARELGALVGGLTGPAGLCQKRLASVDGNQFVLCSKRVIRVLSTGNGGSTVALSRPARFVTKNPDLVEQTIWELRAKRTVSSMAAQNATVGMSVERIPALAERRQALIDRTYSELEKEMPRQIAAPKDEA